jgi:hypothetical protein
MTKHNKKRNVGVIHEQLVRYVGNAIISNDNRAATKAVAIITEYFKAGTELHREFRLFNALVNVPMGDASLSNRVVNEAKMAAVKHNAQRLNQEKSALIKSINHVLSEEKFYDIRVNNYKLYATVQSLLDSWRGTKILEITDAAKFESNLCEWLSRKPESEIKQETIDPLVYRMMLKKFQEKYNSGLLPDQKKVVESVLLKGKGSLASEFDVVQKEAVKTLKMFKKTCENKVLLEKIGDVIERVENFKTDNDEKRLSMTLHLIELVTELKGGDNE